MADLEKMKEEAQKKGERLGFLIAALNVTKEVKESILTILPQMNEEQIEKLISILESAYLDQKTGVLDDNLAVKLAGIQTGYHKDMQKADEEAMKDLKKLESDLLSKAKD